MNKSSMTPEQLEEGKSLLHESEDEEALSDWLLDHADHLIACAEMAQKAVCAWCGTVTSKTPEAMLEHMLACKARSGAVEGVSQSGGGDREPALRCRQIEGEPMTINKCWWCWCGREIPPGESTCSEGHGREA